MGCDQGGVFLSFIFHWVGSYGIGYIEYKRERDGMTQKVLFSDDKRVLHKSRDHRIFLP